MTMSSPLLSLLRGVVRMRRLTSGARSLLLQDFLFWVIELIKSGGIALLEHPAEPAEPEMRSIWKLAVMQLLRHPDVRRLRIC